MKKIALVVGHSDRSRGACNKIGLCEYDYNKELADLISSLLVTLGEYDPVVVYRDTYRDLPNKINEIEPNLIISLHCNAFNTKASGTETLYHHRSSMGREFAKIVQASMVEILGLPDRGIKSKTSEDRGGYLLRYTHAPCLILEPFFIDNDDDLQCGLGLKIELAEAIAGSIKKFTEE